MNKESCFRRRTWIAALAFPVALLVLPIAGLAAQNYGGTHGSDRIEPSSIQVNSDFGDHSEDAFLASKAGIPLSQAIQVAQTSYPSSRIVRAGIENENGSVVYNVELQDPNRGSVSVIVDAGNGKLLGTQSATQDNEHGGEHHGDRTGSESEG